MSNGVSPIDETRRRAFERQWIEHGAADLDAFLPPAEDAAYEATLLELLCIDMEMRHRVGDPTSVSDYVARYGLEAPTRARLDEEAGYLARSQVTRGSRVGKYVLKEVLGQGAFAVVWRAYDPDLSRVVALKRLRPALSVDDEARARFRREAQSAARLRHPAIVTVHEVGEDASGPYLVSDYIPGPTLGEACKKRPLQPAEAAGMVARIADALQYAHEFGIVHRDVKPGNILLDEAGRPLITDFGLAQLGEADATLTRHGQLLGTPAYMAPEQARGDVGAIDRRTDVYGLGVVLYELLCGRPPFQGESASLLYAVVHKDVPRPRSLAPGVPIDLETICLKAMAREPDRRYASVGALADDLRRFLASEPVSARRNGLLGRAALWTRRNPAVAASLGAIAVVVAVAFVRVLEERARFEGAHQRSQANLYRSLVRQAEAQLALPRGAGREAAWASVREATHVETTARDTAALRTLALRYLTAEGPHFRQLTAWTAPEEAVAVALGADGETVVECGPHGTRVRRAATGEVLATDPRPAQALAMGRDGKRIAVANGSAVRIMDATTLAPLAACTCASPPEALALDDRREPRLATASGAGAVEVFALEGATVTRTGQYAIPATCVLFGGGHTVLVGGVEGGVRQIDLATGTVTWTSRFDEPVRLLTSSGARIAAVSYERYRFTMLDPRNGGQREPQRLHDASVRGVFFGPQGYIVTASADGTLGAWDQELARATEARTEGAIQTAACRGARILTVGADGRRSLWTMVLSRGRRRLHADHRACFVAETTVLFTGAWALDCRDGTYVRGRPPRAATQTWGVAVDPTGRFAARTCHDGAVDLMDARDLTQHRRLDAAGDIAWTAAFSDDGRVLAVGAGSDILLFDTGRGTLLRRLTGHDAMVAALLFRGERMYSSGRDGTLRAWDWRAGTEAARVLEGVVLHDLTWVGDALAAAGKDGLLRVWDRLDAPPRVVRVGNDALWAVAASPDGLVATGSVGGHVRLWDATTWQPIAELAAAPRVRSLDFDASGRYLAAAVWRAEGAIWDLTHLRAELARLGLDWD